MLRGIAPMEVANSKPKSHGKKLKTLGDHATHGGKRPRIILFKGI